MPRRSLYVLLLTLVLAIPRIARLLYPQVWIEDEWYLNGAFLLSRGWMPYRDFPLPHLPLLDGFLALVFKIAPVTIRTAEVVTAIAALAGSFLVFAIGERLAGRAAGTLAALIYATSGLLFRYHVFEREIFVVVPVLAAVWMTGRAAASGNPAAAAVSPPLRRPPPMLGERMAERTPAAGRDGGSAVTVGVLLAVAMAIKMTAFAAFVAVVAQLGIEHRRREAWIAAATAIGLLGVASVALALAFGTDFIVQVFVFRIVHASFPSLGVKLNEMRYTLDLAFATGAAGVVFLVWSGRTREWRPVLLQLASGFLFLVLFNATYWAHTGIELLPWLSLCGGALLASAVKRAPAAPAPARRGRQDVTRRAGLQAGVTAWVCVAGAALLVLFVSPIRNLNWQGGDGSPDGFGYRDRSEIEKAAAFVDTHTPDDAIVATPPIIAFAAHRREIVPYAELAGDIGELQDMVRRDGYVAAIEESPLRSRQFWEGVEAGRERIFPAIDAAVAEHALGAVINYSPDDLFPLALVDVSQEKLEQSGYELALITAHYEVWTRRLSR